MTSNTYKPFLQRGLVYIGSPRSEEDRVADLQHLAVELSNGSILQIARVSSNNYCPYVAVELGRTHGGIFVHAMRADPDDPIDHPFTAPLTQLEYNQWTVDEAEAYAVSAETVDDIVASMGCESIKYAPDPGYNQGPRYKTIKGITWARPPPVGPVANGKKNVIHQNTEFVGANFLPLNNRPSANNLAKNYVYLHSELRNGKAPRVYHAQGLQSWLERGKETNPFSRASLKHHNMRRVLS